MTCNHEPDQCSCPEKALLWILAGWMLFVGGVFAWLVWGQG